MGHKINSISLRLGKIENWRSRWFTPKNKKGNSYPLFLEEDFLIRKLIKSKFSSAGIVAIEIERAPGLLKILIKASRPGFIIGQGGRGIEELAQAIENQIIKFRKMEKTRDKKLNFKISINIEEFKRSEISAQHIADQISLDIEKRIPYRLTVKKHFDYLTQNKEIKGAKIMVKGRLNGIEIARHETFKFGSLPLNNLRVKIDYGQATALTTYGTVGIKVWINIGEVFN